jgi:hypothetical protein
MKFLLVLAVVFSGMFYLFGWDEKARVQNLQSIASSPGFAPARVDGVTKVGKKSDSYQVRFKYEVNGVTYETRSTSTDQEGARWYTSQPNLEVAYDRRNPSVASLKRYYDLRDKQETVGRALLLGGILSLLLASPISLGIAWRMGWLRRKH